jgi:flagellar motor switch protein FliM
MTGACRGRHGAAPQLSQGRSDIMTFVDDSLETSAIDLLASALTPQLRSVLMESLSDIIMRKIAFSLSQRMRCPVQLLSCVNGVISHDSAVSALPDVMLAGIADLAPLHGRMIIGVEGDLIGAVVDAMFGATSSDFVNRHELSSMEQRIGKQMIELTIAGLSEVLSSFTPLNWTVMQYETAVGMLAIADKQDWMISTTGIFETALGIGSIRVIVPYSAFEPFEARVNTQTWLIGPAGVDQRWAETMQRLAGSTLLDLQFDLVRAQVPLGVVDSMQIGQVLPVFMLPQAIGLAGGIDLFYADYGQSEGFVCCRPTLPSGGDSLLSRSASELDAIRRPAAFLKRTGREDGTKAIGASVIDRVLVGLTVRLGWTSISVDALCQIRIGQLIRLDQTVEDPLIIFVGGKYLGLGEVVSMPGGRCGIKVTDLVVRPLEV